MNSNIGLKDFMTPAWALIIVGLIVGGSVGLYEMFFSHVFATTQAVTLTTPLIIYIAMALASTGISLLLAYGLLTGKSWIVANTRYLLILDIAVLMGGFTALATELGSILNLVWTFLSPNPASPIWWMSIFYTIKLAILFVKLVLDVLDIHGSFDKPLAALTLVVSAAAAMTIGAVFGTVIARPDYQGTFASVLLVLLAPTAGTALLVVMNRGRELVAAVLPVFRQLAVLAAVLLLVQWIYESRSTVEGLLGWVNPLMLVVFALAAVLGGMVPRIAGLLGLVGIYWVCHGFIITGQLSILGPQQVWYGEVTSFTPNAAEVAIIVLGLSVAGALYLLGRTFLLARESAPDRAVAASA